MNVDSDGAIGTDGGFTGTDRLTVIGRSEVVYLDGAEQRVDDIIAAAADRSSNSMEILSQALNFAERYHTTFERANLLRPFSIAPDARVLEVGAGCGAVTRYLGEQAGQVDALEPIEVRARVALSRTEGLPDVHVLVGDLTDLPDEPTYDVILVVGVLEYVGSGSASDPAYLQFLANLASRLVNGGTLILAIENKLGVKYVSGGPEDHTARPFDSLEGYPVERGIRTFARRELESLMKSAGLSPKTLGAFPDYKFPRFIADIEQFEEAHASLLTSIPHFPSPDWGMPPSRVADEEKVWSTLVQAGVADTFPNSFVCLATKGAPKTSLWEKDTLGVYYSLGRLPQYTSETRIRRDGEGEIQLDRRPILEQQPGADPILQTTSETFVPGVRLDRAFRGAEDPASVELLHRWVELVDSIEDTPVLIDVMPHNVIVGADGLRAIDLEWRLAGADQWRCLRRGALVLAQQFIGRPLDESAWGGSPTMQEAATAIGRVIGLDPEGAWIPVAIDEEVAFLSEVVLPPALHSREQHAEHLRSILEAELTKDLGSEKPVTLQTELEGHYARSNAYIANLEAARSELLSRLDALEGAEKERGPAALQTEMDEHHARSNAYIANLEAARSELLSRLEALEGADKELKALRGTLSWRITAPIRALRRKFR